MIHKIKLLNHELNVLKANILFLICQSCFNFNGALRIYQLKTNTNTTKTANSNITSPSSTIGGTSSSSTLITKLQQLPPLIHLAKLQS
jgi:hypothetical protein